MKILIVEDENKARVGLESLIRHQFSEISVLESATNGMEGIALYKSENPDILITDIKMPYMDGLEMISRLFEEGHSPYTIVLTGYSDFEYAKKCIDFGVKEFLMKPFTVDSISKIIVKAILELRNSNTLSDIMLFQKKLETKSGKNQLLFKFTDQLNVESTYSFLRKTIVKSLPKEAKLEEYSDSNDISFLIITKRNYQLSNKFNELSEKIKKYYPDCLYGVWSSEYNDKTRLNKLNKALIFHKFFNVPFLFEAESMFKSISQTFTVPWKEQKNLINSLRNGDLDFAHKILDEWFDELTKFIIDPILLDQQLEIFLISLLNVFKELKQSSLHLITQKKLPSKIKNSLSRKDTLSHLHDLLFAFSVEESIDYTKHPLINKVLIYINSRLEEPITLESTADHFLISPEHLSRLFKDDIGLGFNNYVNKKKIDIAREMILKSNCTIETVSLSLGYSSPRYFSKVFKRITSLSPREYRNMMLN